MARIVAVTFAGATAHPRPGVNPVRVAVSDGAPEAVPPDEVRATNPDWLLCRATSIDTMSE